MALMPKYLAYGLYLVISPALANDDIGQRLLHNLQQSQSVQEQRLLAPALIQPEALGDGIAPIVIDGQAYAIAATVSEVGQALYVAVSRQQWPDVARLLPIYAALPEHDVTLLWFAQGSWARARGDYVTAIAQYQAILLKQPEFLRAKLELARTLFEDQQNKEALAMFASIAPAELSEGLSATLATYAAALKNREGWHGSFSIGPQYQNNLNQTSQIDLCTTMTADGTCLAGFFASDKIRAVGTTYEATLSKRVQFVGHHGGLLRGVAYGNTYPHEGEYNEVNALLYGGYHFRNAATNVSLLPFLEFNRYGGRPISRAYGLRAEWQQTLGTATSVNLDLEHKRQIFVAGYQHNDGRQDSVFLTLTHSLNPRLAFFGGADFLRKKTEQPVNSHQQRGGRIGVYQVLSPYMNVTAYASYKSRQYARFNAFLGAQRAERELTTTMVLQWPEAKVVGLSPSLSIKRTRVNSNAAYVYRYRKNEVSLRLNKYF